MPRPRRHSRRLRHNRERRSALAAIVDPVATGLVTNLARPGENVTGLSMMAPELAASSWNFSRRSFRRSRVALLSNPANPRSAPQEQAAREAACVPGVRLQLFEARSPGAIEPRSGDDPRAPRGADRAHGPDLRHPRKAHRGSDDETSPASGLRVSDLENTGAFIGMAYLPSLFRRSATYVDKILKGAQLSKVLPTREDHRAFMTGLGPVLATRLANEARLRCAGRGDSLKATQSQTGIWEQEGTTRSLTSMGHHLPNQRLEQLRREIDRELPEREVKPSQLG
jgi:hypothetical protein